MPLVYVAKVYLVFRLPDGSTRQGFFRQSELLKDVIARFAVEGDAFRKGRKRKLNQTRNIGQLKLKNDDVVVINK
jgi:hypothetical protein